MLAVCIPLGVQVRKKSRGMDMRKIVVWCAGRGTTYLATAVGGHDRSHYLGRKTSAVTPSGPCFLVVSVHHSWPLVLRPGGRVKMYYRDYIR